MYTWVMVMSFIVALGVSWGIGANDLANAFGTVYGAKVLSMKQIVILAGICEMTGALLMGSSVAGTISKGIAQADTFDDPWIFMYGMYNALLSTGIWLALATFAKLPVSATHTIVGAVMGFALVNGGTAGVNWASESDEFPYVKGVVVIIISWFTSPVLSLLVSMGTFVALRAMTLRRASSVRRASLSFAFIFFFTMFVNCFFVFSKGMKARLHWSIGRSAWVSLVIASALGIVCFLLGPKIVAYARKQSEEAARSNPGSRRASIFIANEDTTSESPAEHSPSSESNASPNMVAAPGTDVDQPEVPVARPSSGSSPGSPQGPGSAKGRMPSSAHPSFRAQPNVDEAEASSPLINGGLTRPVQRKKNAPGDNGRPGSSTSTGTPTSTQRSLQGEPYEERIYRRNVSDIETGKPGINAVSPSEIRYDTLSVPASSVMAHTPETEPTPRMEEEEMVALRRRAAPYATSVDDGNELTSPSSGTAADQDAVSPGVMSPQEADQRPEVEEFDAGIEALFRYLQIFTSIILSFAHGANDVSNSIGSLAAVWSVYRTGEISKEANVEIWMLGIGGVGIVVGLGTAGRKILQVLGNDLVKLSPSRGFAAQFASAFVVALSSNFGLPVSTTHCITGAVIGIGLAESVKGTVNWSIFINITAGWVATLIAACGFAALLFAQGVYAPSM